jgi:5-methylcytosine-specific restriction protein B
MLIDLSPVLPTWKARVAAWRASADFSTRALIRAERNRNRAAISAHLTQFRVGQMDLDTFRQALDRRTRADWQFFGLKGASGAMFVNMLARNVPDREGVTAALRAALLPPANAGEAEARIRGLTAWLDAGIEADDFGRDQVHPGRAATFLSTCWAAEAPDWPAWWRSAIGVFSDDGIYHPEADRAASYARFHGVYTALCATLGIDALDLEGVCAWAEDQAEAEAAPTPAAEPRPATRRVWLVSPGEGARFWEAWRVEGIVAVGWDYLGDLLGYPDRGAVEAHMRAKRGGDTNPYNDVHACWDFSRTMAPGDIVIAKRGRRRIVGVGVVTGDYTFQSHRTTYQHVRTMEWRHVGDWSTGDEHLVTKTLTDISGYSAFLLRLEGYTGVSFAALTGGLVDPEKVEISEADAAGYTLDDAVNDLFVEREELEEMLLLLRRRKNIVLQGPPGTGKTYVASRIARVLVGGDAPDQIARVQFHQSMSYEDFVQGYRPTPEGGFARKDGPFLRFCHKARQDPESPYVLLIDEINRGNLSRVLGELMLLIEHDKRGAEWAVTLTYGRDDEQPFHVPDNLYIIGTMNTADRSLALVDYALRRRFAFLDVPSAVRADRFVTWLVGRGLRADLASWLAGAMGELNQRIRKDANLGSGFCVGHSYFCGPPAAPDAAWLAQVVQTEVLPLLREYWVDDRAQLQAAEELLDLGD